MQHTFLKMSTSAIAIFTLSGCFYTTSGARTTTPEPGIVYSLPITQAKVQMDLLLIACDGVGKRPKAIANIKITPVANKSKKAGEQFRISGEMLRSWSKKRELEIKLHDHGTIKSINAAVEDKTPEILGNILKIASLGLALGPDTNASPDISCKPEAESALTVSETLQAKIASERALIRGGGSDIEEKVELVNTLAAELTRIQTEHLKISTSRLITFESGTHFGVIDWKRQDFAKWIGTKKPQEIVDLFQVGYCVFDELDTAGIEKCVKSSFTTDMRKGLRQAAVVEEQKRNAAVLAAVGQQPEPAFERPTIQVSDTLVFREPVPSVFRLFALDSDFQKPKLLQDVNSTSSPIYESVGSKAIQTARIPVSQWGEKTEFPLTVSFGGSNTLSATFDAFGAPTSFGWKSSATGASVSSFAASSIESVSGILEAERGEKLKEQKADIEELKTQKELNELENCRSVIENKGFECPE